MSTIAALATPQGTSAIAIIRLSGPKTYKIIEKIFFPYRPLNSYPPRTTILGNIISHDKLIDQVILTHYKAPASYTGEDSAEITCHGGIAIIEKILSLLLSSGARTASPGEFTYRAFLNKKLDLIQAEAVEDLIKAENDIAIEAAHSLLSGRLSAFLKNLKNDLLHEASNIEAVIEFPEEEEVQQNSLEKADTSGIDRIITDISNALDSFEEGYRARSGYRIILLGSPNTGKSTLLNTILGYERAIVSAKAGTTRDYISEKIYIHGQAVTITDMAGIRETSEEIEKAGIEHSIQMIKEASLVFHIIDSSRPKTADDHLTDRLLNETKEVVNILTKTDLPRSIKEEDLPSDLIETSSVNGKGIEEIREIIAEKLLRNNTTNRKTNLLITHIRHKEGLEKALDCLKRSRRHLLNTDIELAAHEIHQSFQELEILLGETTPDDILNNIFSNFCIGK